MTLGAYAAIEPPPGRFGPFSRWINAQNDRTLAAALGERADKPGDPASVAIRSHPCTAYRGARPAEVPGGCPIVVYHCGFGSAFFDNVLLCEQLASHGYIVVTCDYHTPNQNPLNVAGGAVSGADADCLVAWAAKLPYADPARVAMIGHSGGAQAALIHTASSSPFRAYAMLDTTQDAARVSATWMWSFITPVMDGRARIRSNLLFCAGAAACFDLADQLSGADRWYFTQRGMDHDDYTSLGVLAKSQRLDASASAATAGFAATCQAVRSFLDLSLRPDAVPDTDWDRWKRARSGIDSPCLEHAAPGQAVPEYDATSSAPPTPRQARQILDTRGVDPLLRILQEKYAPESRYAVYEFDFLRGQVIGLIDSGKLEEARTLWKGYAPLQPASIVLPKLLNGLADAVEKSGGVDTASKLREHAHVLE